AADALGAHVWGYAAGLDMSRRDLQKHAKQVGGSWEPAKAFDYSSPCTEITPVSVCGHPSKGALWLAVNGEMRQCIDLSQMSWPVEELIAMLSRSVTLMPGDLIFTGTPAGVAPLVPGDKIDAGVDGVGRLSMV